MVGATKQRMTDEDIEQVYGRGWLLTHFLTFSAQRKGQLGRYIDGIQRGEAALDSARAAFGDLKRLDGDLQRYLRSPSFKAVTVTADKLRTEAVAIRKLDPAEQAILPIVMRSTAGVSLKTAQRIVLDARKLAASLPTYPDALAALAEAEHDADNDLAAIAAADQALAIAPNHAKAIIIKARATLDLSEADAAKINWPALRQLLVRANRLDPDHAEPLMLFYLSFQKEGRPPTRNAVDGLLYAQKLVPRSNELRIIAVRQLIADKKLGEAKNLFLPIAYNPHAGRNREALVKVVEALAGGNGTEALATLDALNKPQSGDN